MSGRVPDKIALPTGGQNSAQSENRVPDQIALPTWGAHPTQPDPPPPQPSEPQPQPQHIDPQSTHQQQQQPQAEEYQQDPFQYESPQQDLFLYDIPPPDSWQSQALQLHFEQPQEQLPPDLETGESDNNFNLDLLEQANEAYQLEGRDTFVPLPPQHCSQQEHIFPQYQEQPQQPQSQPQQQPQQPAEEIPPENCYKSCTNCRKIRRHCSGKRPCRTCITANKTCVYDLLPGRGVQAARAQKRARDAAAGTLPTHPSDPAAKRHKTGKFQSQEQFETIQPPLHRRAPTLGVPDDRMCDHCRAGGHRGAACDANHDEQIECSQCTKHRNLADPNHVCTVRGGEYWQKRFANSRPSYPTQDTEASCCTACKRKRSAHRPIMCDIDPVVKIGCTTCRKEGRRCEAYSESRAVGLVLGGPEPAALMWNRPEPGDGAPLVPGRRPWWRHLCQACMPQLGNKKWTPCSWMMDFRLGEYKCTSCVAKGVPCVDPHTGQECTAEYEYPGHGDHLDAGGKSVGRTGVDKCGNCRVNVVGCRGYEERADFACSKCTQWGLICLVRRDGARSGPPTVLPHPDRRWIGWTRNTADTGMQYLACVACRLNGRNCDRKRPCDSCVQHGTECDAFLGGGGLCRRDRTLGADSTDYYMSLGYGPTGVNSDRWDVPEDALVGPNRPKWVTTDVAPSAMQLEAYHKAEAERLAPRTFGDPASQPSSAENGVGQRYNVFFNTLNPVVDSFWGDKMLVDTPAIGAASGGLQHHGDNAAAAAAMQSGQEFEEWLSNFIQSGNTGATLEGMAPFEGRPQNQDEIQQILGDIDMSGCDLDLLADDFADPAAEDEDQNTIVRDIRDAMTAYYRDSRFVPVALRHHALPELFNVLEQAQVPGPERVLLHLADDPGTAALRRPFAEVSVDAPPYERRLRSLLTKWKRPGYNVLKDIPDLPLAEGSLWQPDTDAPRTCEEWKTQPVVVDGTRCARPADSTAICEDLEHMVRPQGHAVCDACDASSRRGLFEGPQPLTRGEFLRMRAYACEGCVEAAARHGAGGAAFGTEGRPTHPVTGCMCALKLLGRRLCMHHRYRLAAQLMVHTMFVAEWAVTNFGHEVCLFCKAAPSKTAAAAAGTGESLLYLCLNCEGAVGESHQPELRDGIEMLLGAQKPGSLRKPCWGNGDRDRIE